MSKIFKTMALLVLTIFIVTWHPSPVLAEEPVWTKGTIKKINTEQGKISIRHGEIKNLDMPPMSMIFRVADAKMLEGLKPKQKIEFYVIDANGRMVIKKIRSK